MRQKVRHVPGISLTDNTVSRHEYLGIYGSTKRSNDTNGAMTMERIEYRGIVDKSEWRRGPWDAEPDKIQWQDEATGLPCIIVRGPVGALCGYVGVKPGHPLHGVDYSECPEKCGESYCDHCPWRRLVAHGGITFADGCAEITRAEWEIWRKRLLARADDAKKFPRGDSARALKEWAACLDDYEAWAERVHARHICHVPGPGEPDSIWWFGFDCAHGGDVSPSMSALGRAMSGEDGEVYRDVEYVAAECRGLAQQLARLSHQ